MLKKKKEIRPPHVASPKNTEISERIQGILERAKATTLNDLPHYILTAEQVRALRDI
jgi:hypothetical protein